MSWAQPRIMGYRKYDSPLQEVTENLFPDVNVKIWSRILIFALSPYEEDNRVKSVIERPWTFGFGLPTLASFGKGSQIGTTERTLELALFLFSSLFTEEMLKKFKADTKKLDYPTNSMKDRKKKELLDIFDGLLKKIENR